MRAALSVSAAVAVLMVSFAAVDCAPAHGSSRSMQWHSIDGGGGISIGEGYQLIGSVGQPDIARMGSDGPMLIGGFWSAARQYCADVTGDHFVDVDDLIEVIVNWNCTSPPTCIGDANGDGLVNEHDLEAVVRAWGPCS